MLGLITERFHKVNCSPDWDLGHIHPQAASCHQASLDKQQEPVDLANPAGQSSAWTGFSASKGPFSNRVLH